MNQQEFLLPIRVYIEDTDAGGVVFYANYLKFMERARTEFLRALGFPKPALLTDELSIVVSSVNIDYKRGATLDDDLAVTARIEKLARSYIIFSQEVFRDDGEGNAKTLLAEAKIKVACVNRLLMKPVPFPNELRSAVTNYLGDIA